MCWALGLNSVSVIRILLYFTGLAFLSIPSPVLCREWNRNTWFFFVLGNLKSYMPSLFDHRSQGDHVKGRHVPYVVFLLHHHLEYHFTNLEKALFFVYVYGYFSCMCVRAPLSGLVPSDPLALELEMVKSHPVDVGNWNPILWKDSSVLSVTEPSLQPPQFFG